MITPEGQVKVMDFGLARIKGQSRLTQEGLVARLQERREIVQRNIRAQDQHIFLEPREQL